MTRSKGELDKLTQHMIDSVNYEGEALTDWEEDFMESITDQWDRKKSLSDRQKEVLERIYCEKVK